MRSALRLFALCIAASLVSCLPNSQHPLAYPNSAKADAALIGKWKFGSTTLLSADEYQLLVIGKPDRKGAPTGELLAIGMGLDRKKRVQSKPPLSFFCVTLGKSKYLDIASSNSHLIARYTVAKGKLTIQFMDDNAVEKAINSGLIKGTVTRNRSIFGSGGKTVLLKETTEDLRKLLADGGGRMLFGNGNRVVFERIR